MKLLERNIVENLDDLGLWQWLFRYCTKGTIYERNNYKLDFIKFKTSVCEKHCQGQRQATDLEKILAKDIKSSYPKYTMHF